MITNTWLLPVTLGLSMGVVYLLPEAGKTAPSAVKMEFPESLDDWTYRMIPPSNDELGTLEKDTGFSKAICLRPRPGEYSAEGYHVPDRVDISVVLSGYDLNNSIHRPERCMPAQGHNITSSQDATLKLANGRVLTAKRLHSVQTLKGADKHGEAADFRCLTYYFFVGHDRITQDHMGRTFIDIKDRLVRGMDQRWAYVSASMWYGNLPWIEREVSEAEADEKLRGFISKFAENQIHWEQLKL
jgi:hypothetical protein